MNTHRKEKKEKERDMNISERFKKCVRESILPPSCCQKSELAHLHREE